MDEFGKDGDGSAGGDRAVARRSALALIAFGGVAVAVAACSPGEDDDDDDDDDDGGSRRRRRRR